MSNCGHALTPDNVYRWQDKRQSSMSVGCRCCKLASARSRRMKDCHGVVYVIRNTVNAKVYVGLTTWSAKARLSQFRSIARKPEIVTRHGMRPSLISDAMGEIGPECFSVEVVERCADQASLEVAEKAWIERLGAVAPGGYNRHVGGAVNISDYSPKVPKAKARRPLDEIAGSTPALKWTPKRRALFESLIDRRGARGCWLWRGQKHRAHGRFLKHGAHRLAYELWLGLILPGLCVLHRCDVGACVNPAHLFLGTQADNMADMRRKGRGRWGTKLSQSQVVEIRSTYVPGVHAKSMSALARQFGVRVDTVRDVIRRAQWKHVA